MIVLTGVIMKYTVEVASGVVHNQYHGCQIRHSSKIGVIVTKIYRVIELLILIRGIYVVRL